MTRATITAASALALAAMGLAAGAVPARADEFFKGKTVVLLIGGTAGGGLDNIARMVARALPKHLGAAQVTPQLMPGAGGIRVLDYLYSNAPRDGSTLAATPSGPLIEPLVASRKMAYSITDFTAIGAVLKDVSLCVSWHESPFRTIQDAMTKEMTVAGTGAASTTDTFPIVVNAAIGTKFKVITGYLGTKETALAIERGETHGRCGWTWSSLKGTQPDWLKEKKINIIMQMGAEKSAEFPDVPWALDLAKTPEDRQMLRLMFAPLGLSNAFLAPPGLPAERTTVIRKAFLDTLADKDIQKEASLLLGNVAPSPTSGEAMQKLLGEIYATPPAVVDRLKAALAPK